MCTTIAYYLYEYMYIYTGILNLRCQLLDSTVWYMTKNENKETWNISKNEIKL